MTIIPRICFVLPLIVVGILLESMICETNKQNEKVAYGSDASRGDLPFQVALLRKNGNFFGFFMSYSQFCGGTIIGDRAVLTAAHCMDNAQKEKLAIAAGITNLNFVFLGAPPFSTILSLFGMGNMIVRDVSNIWVHPEWTGTQTFTAHDVAVMQLEKPLPVGNWAIDWAELEENKNITLGTDMFVSGWGKTEKGVQSKKLQKAVVPLVDGQMCSPWGLVSKDNEICAGNGKQDTCAGDSGGPIGRFAGDNKRFKTVGVVSWGSSSQCGTFGYGAYAKVAAFRPWIMEQLNRTNTATSDAFRSHDSLNLLTLMMSALIVVITTILF